MFCSDWTPSSQDPDAWRGKQHLEDWPRELAGPEYQMWRAKAADEETGCRVTDHIRLSQPVRDGRASR